jgi:hypothetical protein
MTTALNAQRVYYFDSFSYIFYANLSNLTFNLFKLFGFEQKNNFNLNISPKLMI